MIRLFVLAAAVVTAGISATAAQEQSPRDRLIDLATIEVTHELCSFELDDERETAIATERNRMLDDGDVTQKEVDDVRDELAAALSRQVPEGLCKPGRPGELLYRRLLGTLGAH